MIADMVTCKTQEEEVTLLTFIRFIDVFIKNDVPDDKIAKEMKSMLNYIQEKLNLQFEKNPNKIDRLLDGKLSANELYIKYYES